MSNWANMRPVRKSIHTERGRYQRWVKYLKDSRLTEEQIHERATRLTEQGREPDR